MNTTQIQSLIENLRQQTAANSITPTMVANILTELNNTLAAAVKNDQSVTIESSAAPLLYCEVVSKQLFVRNADYYLALGLVPILFRYVKKRNRWEGNKKVKRGPRKKGWFAYGKQGTLHVDGTGLVRRTKKVVNKLGFTSEYSNSPATFVEFEIGHSKTGISWGQSKIKKDNGRMIRLPFAIGFAPKVTTHTAGVRLSDLVSNLAPFYVRGQSGKDGEYKWSFSR